MSRKKTPGRPVSPGAHGPVYELRQRLAEHEGARVSRAELGRRVGCSEDTIQRAELSGTLPASPAVQKNLCRLARKF